MKPNIHPEYKETVIKCACGNEIKTRSTVKDLRVEICSACHPFYTKQHKIVDSTGRVDKFKKKYNIK
ncbi:MAG: 50S ribosomal protein L31 [Spirochaetes bacterium]|jgi:large subunit ribosomal protein L31|nr:50S ribosomal protein L31 [Spirochaetota bacterium]